MATTPTAGRLPKNQGQPLTAGPWTRVRCSTGSPAASSGNNLRVSVVIDL